MSVSKQERRPPYIGQWMPRFEDLRLVTGNGRYADDISYPDQSYAIFVRSPHAHARITGIDSVAAQEMDGVIAVLSARDYAASGAIGVSHNASPADTLDYKIKVFGKKGTPFELPHLPFADSRVRYVGEPVAVVIADSVAHARAAAEAVAVDYEVLPAVVDSIEAMKPGAPQLFDQAPRNIAMEDEFGDAAAVEAAMAKAHLVVAHTFRATRAVAAQMEPRAVIGRYDTASNTLTFDTGSQGAVRVKTDLAAVLKMPPEKVHVITKDVGGAFGLRTHLNPEQIAIAWAARHLNRTVKWTSDRTEAFLADYQGRDMVTKARLAVDERGKILALSVDMTGNVGGHPVSYVFLNNAYRVQPTAYDFPLALVKVRGVLTNTVPTAPYRGAGRPEAILTLERLIDMAATKLGIDRAEIRRRNLIKRSQLPYKSPVGLTYDSGDFTGNQKKVAEAADWRGFAARRRAAKKRNRLAGIGIANYVETPVGAPMEWVDVKVLPRGEVQVAAGTQSSGQGHETTFAQVMADRLGVTPQEVKILTGDTSFVVTGGGTHSDRSMRMAGKVLVDASDKIVAQARKVFAALTDVKESEIAFDDGLFSTPKSNIRMGVFDIAKAIETEQSLPPELRKPLAADANFVGRIPAYPTGSAVCEVEIDPDTGVVSIMRYTSVDDAGQVINPMILHGQTHGGIVQGAGQALSEVVVHDPDSGQVLSASFMDYAMLRADQMPSFNIELVEDPIANNVLRVKGGGEAGITPALATIMNAVVDALSVYGIEDLEMPATPARVWEAIQAAKKKSAAK
ncbi:MAG: xanthine dehydrogenase family protein molybdopterin-binding subunit [Xanthobacteraceae bacterium]